MKLENVKNNEIFNSNNDYSVRLNNVDFKDYEEKVYALIHRDLKRLNWKVRVKKGRIEIEPPLSYDKDIIKQSMSYKREEIISNNKAWIEKHIHLAKNNLACGKDVLESAIEPIIKVCTTQKDMDLFRILRYYWSSPYSEYVGRRIKLIIRDNALPNQPVIGIAALGSPIIHIPSRDNWIGWDKPTRTKNIVYSMDAYVLGALPPYNYLLGGKLISYIIASNEVREIYKAKYKDKITNIDKRYASDLACIFTTSLYGRSSQYNRMRYNNDMLYQHIGETKGYGTLHLTEETFTNMLLLLKENNIIIPNEFGDGPSWRMRVIRAAGDILGFDSEVLLQHSFRRSIYAIPLARNFREYLLDEATTLEYFNYPLNDLVSYWKNRWLSKRLEHLRNKDNYKEVLGFRPENFIID